MFKTASSVFIILTIVALGLSSCAQSSDCFQEDVFCAGLVTDSQGIEDHGLNQDTWAGLEKAKADGIVDRVEYISSIESRDYEKNIAYFVEQGFDVIVTVGPGLSDETLRAANLQPDSAFVGINQPESEFPPNFIPVTFPEDQMGFLAGALAVRISKTQVIGGVCETSGIDAMWRYCEGFRAGAMFFNQLAGQNVNVLVVYRESGDSEKLFIDEEWGYDTAQGLIHGGADVVFAAGGATGQGALRAAAEAGIKSIGTERDQGAVLAGSGSGVVTSVLGDASSQIRGLLRQLGEGSAANPQVGQFKYVPLDQTNPENLTQQMNMLFSALQNGEVSTGVSPSKP